MSQRAGDHTAKGASSQPGGEAANPGALDPASALVPRVGSRFFEFALLGMLASGFAAVASSGALDWPSAALTILALCVRALLIAGIVAFRIPTRVVAALALAYLGFFPLDYYYVSRTFLEATVHMVFFLAVLKLLTAKTARDYGYLKVIGGLELVAAAILSSGPAFLACLALFVLFAIATFAAGEVRRAAGGRVVVARDGLKAFPRRLGLLTASLFAGILVMTAALFFVLPRTARAAFGRFAPQTFHLAGFSNSVTLGEIGEIKQSSIAVMRARSYQNEGFLNVKWRGAALSQFDGHRWFNLPNEEIRVESEGGVIAIQTAVQGRRQGRKLIYQVHLEPLVSDTLFFAGNPETISIQVPFLRYSRAGTFHVSPRFGMRGLNYSVYGFLPDEWAEVRFTSSPLPQALRQELLTLPPLDPRIAELTRGMVAGADSEVQRARAIENRLRHDYGYTLQLLKAPVADPLAHFLFERKKGHCEYFASAMAVMLRTQGIPARVITGFQSGTYNPMTGWQLVRASDAHSWVEAWLEGRGWTTFDPTPPDPSAGQPGFLSQLSLLSDAAQQFWQDWVMSYDLDHQAALASRMRELRWPNWQDVSGSVTAAFSRAWRWIPWVAAIVASALLAVLSGPVLLAWWRRVERGESRRTDATVLYQQLLALLEKRGLRKPPWMTPTEFALVIRAPEIARLAGDATSAYNELRFGGRADAAPRMLLILQQIEKL